MKKGISLIVLIIAIIVIIILASTIILNLTKNNPIESAKKAKFLNDVINFKDELLVYKLAKHTEYTGEYNEKILNANMEVVHENGITDTSRKMTDIIISMKDTKYIELFEIVAGELVYIGNSQKESEWLDGIVESSKFKIELTTIPDMNSISGKVKISGVFAKADEVEYYRIYISKVKETFEEMPNIEKREKSKEIEYELTGLDTNQEYYIKVEVKMEKETGVRTYISDKIVTKVDTIAPNNANILVPQYSNENNVGPVAITLIDNEGGSGIQKSGSKYLINQISTRYDINDNVWLVDNINLKEEDFVGNTATKYLDVGSDGEYYIHVLSIDNAGNKTSTISNKIIVDTVVPNEADITIPTNTAISSIQATVKMKDNDGGSGLNLSECKYIYSSVSYPYGDTESIWDTANEFTDEEQIITVESSTNEIYYLHVLLVDNAGNRREVLSSGVTTNTETPVAPDIEGTVESNKWTNTDVTLTIKEINSPGIVQYEYIINGSSWQIYNNTDKIVIKAEGVTTIKARAVNNVGTIGAESTGYIVNIEKIEPIVTYGTNGGNNVQIAGTGVTVSDLGGSNINISTLQYVWDTQDSIIPSNGWSTFTNGATLTKTSVTGTYYLWIKASDNAGNSVVSKSNSFTIDNTAPTVPTFTPSTTAWTNGNVTVTIIYPSDAVAKEYSTNGTTWHTYTIPIVVNTNNTTVYARGKDEAGNQSSASTLTVSNIDKTAPTISVNVSNDTTTGFTITAYVSDIGSGINIINYYVDGVLKYSSTNTVYKVTGLTGTNHNVHAVVYDNVGYYTTSDTKIAALHVHTDACYTGHQHTNKSGSYTWYHSHTYTCQLWTFDVQAMGVCSNCGTRYTYYAQWWSNNQPTGGGNWNCPTCGNGYRVAGQDVVYTYKGYTCGFNRDSNGDGMNDTDVPYNVSIAYPNFSNIPQNTDTSGRASTYIDGCWVYHRHGVFNPNYGDYDVNQNWYQSPISLLNSIYTFGASSYCTLPMSMQVYYRYPGYANTYNFGFSGTIINGKPMYSFYIYAEGYGNISSTSGMLSKQYLTVDEVYTFATGNFFKQIYEWSLDKNSSMAKICQKEAGAYTKLGYDDWGGQYGIYVEGQPVIGYMQKFSWGSGHSDYKPFASGTLNNCPYPSLTGDGWITICGLIEDRRLTCGK